MVEFVELFLLMNTIFFQYLIILIKAAYIVSGSVLFLYGINSLILALIYLINRKRIWAKRILPEMKNWPIISIQLPIYNEGSLVKSLLASISKLNYPRQKLQIQILDDSTDSTSILLNNLVEQYKQNGFWIEYQHRDDRKGFKAGNLNSGLKNAKGEYIAIFDADFEIKPDFFFRTIPYFNDEKIGFVQARWENRNLFHTLTTCMGGIAYDGHLFVEQNARFISGLFMGFSGSGGIWRTKCLKSIGAWQTDSITEDIDITFRVQLKGWHGIYVPEALTIAELPEKMNAYKLQQYRWARGSAQSFRKYIGQVIRVDLPLKVKFMACLHLISYVTIPCLPIVLLLVLPVSLYGGGFLSLFWWMALGGIGPILTFGISQLEQKANLKERLLHLPFVMLMAVGISLDAFTGVMAGLFQYGGEFVRTQRTMEEGQNSEKERKSIFLTNLTIAEISMGIYLIGTVYILWSTSGKLLAPWLLSSAAGLFLMAGTSIIQFITQEMKKELSQEHQ